MLERAMPTCATVHTLIHSAKRSAVATPPQQAERKPTLQLGMIQKKSVNVSDAEKPEIANRAIFESRSHSRQSDIHLVTAFAPNSTIAIFLHQFITGNDIAAVAVTGSSMRRKRYTYARFQIGRGLGTPHI